VQAFIVLQRLVCLLVTFNFGIIIQYLKILLITKFKNLLSCVAATKDKGIGHIRQQKMKCLNAFERTDLISKLQNLK